MFYLLVTVILLATSQILLKFGVSLFLKTENRDIYTHIYDMINSVPVVFGIILAGVASITWTMALNKYDLSYAYPFMMIPLPLVLILSMLIFGERISSGQLIGMFLLLSGVFIMSRF
jgi:drug/metabolite transporter (DMT)-like permease